MKRIVLLMAIFCGFNSFSQKKQKEQDFSKSENNLVLQAPINSWDEAIPLGNGLTGGLLWGEKNSFDFRLTVEICGILISLLFANSLPMQRFME